MSLSLREGWGRGTLLLLLLIPWNWHTVLELEERACQEGRLGNAAR